MLYSIGVEWLAENNHSMIRQNRIDKTKQINSVQKRNLH